VGESEVSTQTPHFSGQSNYGGVVEHIGAGLGERMNSAFSELHPAVVFFKHKRFHRVCE
jgi:hypothetical protein